MSDWQVMIIGALLAAIVFNLVLMSTAMQRIADALDKLEKAK